MFLKHTAVSGCSGALLCVAAARAEQTEEFCVTEFFFFLCSAQPTAETIAQPNAAQRCSSVQSSSSLQLAGQNTFVTSTKLAGQKKFVVASTKQAGQNTFVASTKLAGQKKKILSPPPSKQGRTLLSRPPS